MQSTLLILHRRFNELENGLQSIFLLGTIEFVAMDDRLGDIIRRPPRWPRPVHHVALPVRDADQVANLHLAQAQSNILTANFFAGLNNPGALANASMADNAWRQIRFGQNFSEDLLHLRDIHVNLDCRTISKKCS